MMLSKNDTILIVIDFQEKMLPHIENGEEILKNAKKLIKAAKIFNIPIIVTKQRKLGDIVDEIRREIEIEPIEKITFSCYREEKFKERIKKEGKRKCLLIGIETHICVLQTALDLLKEGYEVHVATDCTGSRKEKDKEVAIQKMITNGIIPTTAETAIYEMLESADKEEFKDILKIIKSG